LNSCNSGGIVLGMIGGVDVFKANHASSSLRSYDVSSPIRL